MIHTRKERAQMKNRIVSNKTLTFNNEDRLALATLLVKAGYSVRIGKEKTEGKSTTITFIE